MDINTDSMTQVQDVNKRSHSPDLKYSEQTERWTMNEKVQDALNLGDSRGLNMHVAEDEETGETVVLVEIVPAEEASFFKGSGNVFIARRLADAIDHHSFALNSVDNLDGEFYVLNDWEGDSEILDGSLPMNSDNSSDNEGMTEEVTTLDDDSSEDEVDDFDYSADEFQTEEEETDTIL